MYDNEYYRLLMTIIDDEIRMTSDYEEYDSINNYRLTLRTNHIADDELHDIADEFVGMGFLIYLGYSEQSRLKVYKLTEHFKENYFDIINLYLTL